jgi:hypothetical protein
VQKLFQFIQQRREPTTPQPHQQHQLSIASSTTLFRAAREGEAELRNLLASPLTLAEKHVPEPLDSAAAGSGSVFSVRSLMQATNNLASLATNGEHISSIDASLRFPSSSSASGSPATEVTTTTSTTSTAERAIERVFERLSILGDLIPAIV